MYQDYTNNVRDYVSSQCPPATFFHCQNRCRCRDPECLSAIQDEYDILVSCLKMADSSLPRSKPGIEKDWWTDGLSELRCQSIEIHNIWKDQGCPRQGPANDERLRIHAAYKRALRAAQCAPKQMAWDRLHTALTENDTDSFWRSWKKLYNKNGCHLPPVVDGCSSGEAIASCFKNCFQKNSRPNNTESVDRLNQEFASKFDEYVKKHSEACDCSSFNISTVNIIDAVISMKAGKTADEEGISAEHLHNAPVVVMERLCHLFNMMLRHGSVPSQFRRGFMIPIIKDQSGNHSDSDNYRGITISPVVSKLFEHVLKNVFFETLSTNEHQYGFKRNSSTVHAIHCLKQTVNFYANNGSRVFCSFLDASKAFDRLIHSGLFIKLMERNVPLVFLDVIISWYDGLICRVKWGEWYSDWFCISAGVRQGGVLSPDFYCIYVDALIIELKKAHKGCHYLGRFAAAYFYADDMCVLAPSIKGLDALLKICESYCAKWDICLNAKKSRNLYFGKRTNISHDIILNGKKVEWAESWPYLGVTLKSGKMFDCSVTERVKKFYRCANAILRIDGKSNDLVMLRLIETHCVPLLTYAIEVVHVQNRDEKRQLRVAYNSVFRRIFGYRWSQSVSALQNFLVRPTWEQLVEKRKSSFVARVHRAGRDTLALALLQ